MKAVILCGGRGNRLRPLTDEKPKPMVEVNGKPILEHQIEFLKKHGISEIYLCTGYKHEVIENYFGDGSKFGVKIFYSKEDEPLGTGGAIRQLRDTIKEPFVLMNGDMITDLDFSEFIRKHLENKTMITTFVYNPTSPWGMIEMSDGLVKGFVEKPKLSQLINTGIHVMSPEIFELLPEKGSLEVEVLPLLAEKLEIAAFKHDGFWKAVETMKDLEEMNKVVKELE